MTRPAVIHVAAFAFLMMLASCSEPKTAAPPSAPAKPAQTPVQPIPPAQPPSSASTQSKLAAQTEEKKPEAHSYVPGGRRDPFTPLIIKEEKKGSRAGLPPLERYALSEFKFTGVIWGGFGYNAVLEGPDGKGYFIRIGTRVGPNGGVVKKITQSALVIEEKYKTFSGETKRKEIVVELRRKQEGTP